jgi:UDP-N-acetylglucosamine 4,6-dehydratase
LMEEKQDMSDGSLSGGEGRKPSSLPKQIVVIGLKETAIPVAQSLAAAAGPPVVRGVVLLGDQAGADQHEASDVAVPILGSIADLPLLHARYRFDAALVTLPRAMKSAIESVRTALDELGVAFRFMPTAHDALTGASHQAPIEMDLSALVGRAPRPIEGSLVRRAITGKRVAITGAGGSIGSELCRIAAAYEPAELLLLERSENALFEIDRELAARYPEAPTRALLHDVVDERATLELFRRYRPEVIFHAAAHKHVPMMEDHPSHAVNNNVFGTKSVADAALAVGASRFVLISTDKAVDPSSVMGATKRFAEHYVRSLNAQSTTRCLMVRFGNVLGSSGSVLTTWSRQLAAARPITITDSRMTRYFMTIPEAAALVMQTSGLSSDEAGDADVFVLDMGEPVRIFDLAERFIESHGLTPVLDGQPAEAGRLVPAHPITITSIRPGEKLHEQLAHEVEELRPTLIPGVQAWAGSTPAAGEVDRMVEDLSHVRHAFDDKKVLSTITGWTPSFEKQGVRPIEQQCLIAKTA